MIDIKGYEGLYAITEDGQVWSYRNNRFLKPGKHPRGYLCVNLWRDGKQKTFLIHRLVAEAYIENDSPETKTFINHCDGIKTHNWIKNLEWCTPSENIRHAYDTGLQPKTHKERRVHCIENGRIYKNCGEAAKEFGCNQSHIYRVCTHESKTAHGFHFEFVD